MESVSFDLARGFILSCQFFRFCLPLVKRNHMKILFYKLRTAAYSDRDVETVLVLTSFFFFCSYCVVPESSLRWTRSPRCYKMVFSSRGCCIIVSRHRVWNSILFYDACVQIQIIDFEYFGHVQQQFIEIGLFHSFGSAWDAMPLQSIYKYQLIWYELWFGLYTGIVVPFVLRISTILLNIGSGPQRCNFALKTKPISFLVASNIIVGSLILLHPVLVLNRSRWKTICPLHATCS